VVGVSGEGVGECETDGGGMEEDVGVGEEEVTRGGVAGGEGHGVGFAEPAGREFGDVDGTDSFRVLGGDGVDDGAGLVGAAVVDGDDVEVGVFLGEESVQRCGDAGGFVACRDDHRDRGRSCWGDVVLRIEEIGDAREADGGGNHFPEPGEGDEPRDEFEGEDHAAGIGWPAWRGGA
jgi:hypothetical protein